MARTGAPFITFEGGEGSGKSTQAKILHETLVAQGINVISYREPGGTPGAEEIRNLLMQGDKSRWNAKTEALLMSAARADLIYRHIIPELEQGQWVICDRFADSTTAYQGFGHGLGYDKIMELNDFTIETLEPNLTFIFQISPELGMERVMKRKTGHYRFEQLDMDFHRRVAEGYAEVLEKNPHRCIPIDATQDIETTTQVILSFVKERFLD